MLLHLVGLLVRVFNSQVTGTKPLQVQSKMADHLLQFTANKGLKRYRYYVSQHLHHKTSAGPGWRMPAREVEGLIGLKLQELLRDPIGLFGQMQLNKPAPDRIANGCEHSALLASNLEGTNSGLIPELVTEATVSDAAISVAATAHLLNIELPMAERQHPVRIAARLTRSGVAMKLPPLR
jgi:hypothetical protein